MERIGLALVDLFLRKLVVRDGVEPFHACRHIAIRNTLHFKFVHAGEIGDLLEAQRGVVYQPDGGGPGHDRFGHVIISLTRMRPLSANLSRRLKRLPFGGRVTVVGELGRYIVEKACQEKPECT